jgi:ligand-binding SRPBCC domain-containing protein
MWLPAPRERVFQFFADAENLEWLTPPWLKFRVITPLPIVIGRGTVIDYRLRLRGIPLRWRSEISAWDPPHRFVDEQRRGPYRRWVHTHTFDEDNGGTRVGDAVDFDMAGGPLVAWLVKRDIRTIFAFRREALLRRFT